MISGGHLLSVISFLFFIIMLVDSFFEGRAPTAGLLGVPRLNTRLAFYAYERRKLLILKSSGCSSVVSSNTGSGGNVPQESTLLVYLTKDKHLL